MTHLKQITQSKYFVTALGALGCLIAAAIVFAAGVHVGERRARYSYQWGANYERNFLGGPREMMDGPRGPIGRGAFGGGPLEMMQALEGRDFRNSHGVSGEVTAISDNTIIIKDRDGKENTILVDDKTIIKDGRSDIKITDLSNDEKIVAMGTPGDDGVIKADLIRVFDKNINIQK
jgi:hypothetical protein